MKTLELKHLASYLPYGLKFTHEKYDMLFTMIGIMESDFEKRGVWLDCDSKEMDYQRFSKSDNGSEYKPILRPLSDLTKEIEHGEKLFYPFLEMLRENNFKVEEFTESELEKWNLHFQGKIGTDVYSMMFVNVQQLFEWHFDVFGLIDQGLAIDINTL